MQVNGSLLNQGIFKGNGTAALLTANSIILDLSGGTCQNLGVVTLSMSNSLLIVPAGFNPAAVFAGNSVLGLTHTLGTTLTVPAGQGFGGSGSISDSVACQGTIAAASGGAINLNAGLTLYPGGMVNLGNGGLTSNGTLSAINGGSLTAANHYVGNGGTGSFTQSGGTSSLSSILYLGYNAGDSGAYSLNGQLSVSNEECLGYSGTGTFTQIGGTNNTSFSLARHDGGASSTYNLSGSGQLSTGWEYVGDSGAGTLRSPAGRIRAPFSTSPTTPAAAG